jgi:CBS domain containing-hemolysin-like protein
LPDAAELADEGGTVLPAFVSLPLVVLLVVALALLVGSQFVIARLRVARLREGPGVRPLEGWQCRVADQADAWVVVTQLGIVLVALCIGWLVGPMVVGLLATDDADAAVELGIVVVFALTLVATAVAGRLVPRLLASRLPEAPVAAPRPHELGHLTVRDLMVPRTRIDALPANLARDEARDRMLESGRARIPVYRDTIDQIVGMLEWARLFSGTDDDWAADIEPMLVVPESMDAADALARMRERPVPEVLVVDEYGGTAGLLTMAALVNQLSGRRSTVTLPASVPGDHPIHVLERDLSIRFPATEATTLAGFIAERLGHIPTTGDAVEVAGHQLVVATVTGRRIRTIRVE